MSVGHTLSRCWRIAPVGLLAAALLLSAGGQAQAGATITVDTLSGKEADDADDDDCSLEEAIENANADRAVNDDCPAGSGADTINIEVAGTINVHSTGFTINSDVTINGAAGGTTIRGVAGLDIYSTDWNSSPNRIMTAVTLANLTISGATTAVAVVDSFSGKSTLPFSVTLQNLLIEDSTFGVDIGRWGSDSARPAIVVIKDSDIRRAFRGISHAMSGCSSFKAVDTVEVRNSTLRDGRWAVYGRCGPIKIIDSTIANNNVSGVDACPLPPSGRLDVVNSTIVNSGSTT